MKRKNPNQALVQKSRKRKTRCRKVVGTNKNGKASSKKELKKEKMSGDNINQTMLDSSPCSRIRSRNPNLTHFLFAKEEVWVDHKDSPIIDRVIEQFNEFNVGATQTSKFLAYIGAHRIKQMVLGPKHVAFLLNDSNVIRVPYETARIKENPKEGAQVVNLINSPPGLQSARASATKYRRVMLGNRTYCRIRAGPGDPRGVIIGGRAPIPAANVPEELINNVQQVLQGKSREVIVRELQRTGLNVNEAVNNLLSRDDGDDGMDMGNDQMLPDELIQLLEQSTALESSTIAASVVSGSGVNSGNGGNGENNDNRYGEYERESRSTKKNGKDKDKKKKDDGFKSDFQLGKKVEWWCGEEGMGIPHDVFYGGGITEEELKSHKKIIDPSIVKIVATSWQLLALHQNGKVYSWKWNESRGSDMPIKIHKAPKESNDNKTHLVVKLSASNCRISVITLEGYFFSWLDEVAVGQRASQATESMGSIPKEAVANLQDLTTSDYISAVRVANAIYWCGFYPPTERHKLFEKEKTEKEKKKHVSFNDNTNTNNTSATSVSATTSSHEFTVGSQIQLKKSPMYPAGSVAIYIDTCEPVIGVLLEDAWGTSESCRFRVLSVQEYDDELKRNESPIIVKQEIEEEEHGEAEVVESTASKLSTQSVVVANPNVMTINERQPRKRKMGRTMENHDIASEINERIGKRVEMWSVEEVMWIHEHRKRDVMTVTLTENNLLSARYNDAPKSLPYASIWSDQLDEDQKVTVRTMTDRLFRKEDVQLFTKKGENRSPKVIQKEVMKVTFESMKQVLAMVADLNGLRVLVKSKSDGLLYLCRMSVSGKVLSKRRLPIHQSAISRIVNENGSAELLNFGDARTLFLRDVTGQLIPLVRDALSGFREPPVMNAPPIRLIATMARPTLKVSAAVDKGSTWEGSVLIIPGNVQPYQVKFNKHGASLMQMVLYCDVNGVKRKLDRLNELRLNGTLSEKDFEAYMNEQLFGNNSDGCSSLLHAAIRMCLPGKNSLNVDRFIPPEGKKTQRVSTTLMHLSTIEPSTPPPPPPPPPPSAILVPATPLSEAAPNAAPSDGRNVVVDVMEVDESAGAHAIDEDSQQRDQSSPAEGEAGWKGRLRGRNRQSIESQSTQSSNCQTKGRRRGSDGSSDSRNYRDGSEDSVSSLSSDSTFEKEELSCMPFGIAVVSPEIRQANAIIIVELLLESKAILFDSDSKTCNRNSMIRKLLMSQDIAGMTPLMLAINIRAFAAAYTIWSFLKQCQFNLWPEEEKLSILFPGYFDGTNVNLDDSPLFVLCYNDVCSFTWTGEDHINQDIYECRTCGLTGSLCCCSECALTCHRNHDCKLKRTSPTAYCDCWEKCRCKALIAGNEKIREYLLNELLENTELYKIPNARHEHIILFLAKTVVRQIKEQNGQTSRKRNQRGPYRSGNVGGSSAPQHNTPEHDLNPPKFARFALEKCVRSSKVVKTAIQMGVAVLDWEMPISRDNLYFLTQNSSTHLDKLAFTMMNKRLKEYSNTFINTIKHELHRDHKQNRDEEVEEFANRFVRSVIRIIALAINISPTAASIIMSGEEAAELALSQATSQANSSAPREDRLRFFSSIGFSGILPLVKRDSSSKHLDKTSGLVQLVCRAVWMLRSFSAIATLELSATADAIMAPVRYGVVKPLINPVIVGNHDPLDIMEKFFMSELSFEEVIKRAKKEEKMNGKELSKKAKKRRDAERDIDMDRRESVEDETLLDQDDGNSESQDGLQNRGDSVSGSMAGFRSRRRNANTNATSSDDHADPSEDGQNGATTGRDFDVDVEDSNGDEEMDEDEDDIALDSSRGEVEDESTNAAENRVPNVRLLEDDDEDDEDEDDEDEDDDEEEDDDDRQARDAEDMAVWQYEPSSPSELPDEEEHEDDDQDQSSNSNDNIGENNTVPASTGNNIQIEMVAPPANGSDGNNSGPIGNNVVDGAVGNNARNDDQRVDDSDDDFLSRQHLIAARFSLGNRHTENTTSSQPQQQQQSNQETNRNNRADRTDRTDRTREGYQYRRGNWATRGSIRVGGYENMQYAFGNQSPIYENRRDFGRNDSGNVTSTAGGTTGVVDNSSGSSGAPSTTQNTTTSPSGSSGGKRGASTSGGVGGSGDSSSESKASVAIAKQQLSMTFSLLVRLGCDILMTMEKPPASGSVLEEKSVSLQRRIKLQIYDVFSDQLKETFNWLIMLMDCTESKLRFNLGYTEKIENAKSLYTEEKGTRKEVFNYMMSLMRSNGDELKDHLQQPDMEMLTPLAFVLDAYLVFLNIFVDKKIEVKQIIDQYDDSWRRKHLEICDQIDMDLVIGFFMRPTSLSFPGDILEGAWNTVNGRDGKMLVRMHQDVPLAERSDLLTMDSTPSTMFKASNESLRTAEEHLRNPVEKYVYHSRNGMFNLKSSYLSMGMGMPKEQLPHLTVMETIRDHYKGRVRKHVDTVAEWPRRKKIDWRMSSGYPVEQRRARDQVDVLKRRLMEHSCAQGRILFSKWQRTIETIAEQCYDKMSEVMGPEVSYDHSILLKRIARFGVKHQFFIKAAEKYRTMHAQSKEVTMDVHREQSSLIRNTMVYLNQLYNKKVLVNRSGDPAPCPLAGTRLRVRFIDEPGEGTGVTRSFYTAFAEACVQLKMSPFMSSFENAVPRNEREDLIQSLNWPRIDYAQNMELLHRNRRLRREKSQRLRNSLSKLRAFPLNIGAPRFDFNEGKCKQGQIQETAASTTAPTTTSSTTTTTTTPAPTVFSSQALVDDLSTPVKKSSSPTSVRSGSAVKSSGDNTRVMKRLHKEISRFVNVPSVVGRIMGVLCHLPTAEFNQMLDNDDTLRLYIQHVCIELRADNEFDDTPETTPLSSQSMNFTQPPPSMLMMAGLDGTVLLPMSPNSDDAIWAAVTGITSNRIDDGPLFEKTPNGNFFVPRIGNGSSLRVSAFRNVGRVMGVCLSQGDIFPMRLARHVLAYILHQPVTFLDLGFYDHTVFNSLRSMLCSNQDDEDTFACQTFSIEVPRIVDGKTVLNVVPLRPNGANIPIDKYNVVEYVYKYSEYLLLGPHLPALESIREGVLDVIPESMLAGLTPEDFRLIMCGTEQICIETLQSNTTFLDESRATTETLNRFKQWFWQVVESLSRQEKQDLVFFWTGTPTLPPSGEWQTNATVMLRPAEDMFLPTANTCISRLYVPVYSTKRILRSKLLMAVKAKNFGFV